MLYEPLNDNVYTDIHQFKLAYPNTSFGELITEEDLNLAGLYTLMGTPPKIDPKLEKCIFAGIILKDGYYFQEYTVIPLPLPESEKTTILIQRYTEVLDSHLDNIARARRYDDRKSCALRAGYAGPFQAEGTAFAIWMDTCNMVAYQILTDVQSGNRQPPESIDAFIAELPTMVWPD